ncbi:unnamed protein product [Linum trigynum]|uniref:Uncharacterized protein n=1 Tax=Linum trigynum TaxID=586398 RepID=A0AAV2FB38_9ROSI
MFSVSNLCIFQEPVTTSSSAPNSSSLPLPRRPPPKSPPLCPPPQSGSVPRSSVARFRAGAPRRGGRSSGNEFEERSERLQIQRCCSRERLGLLFPALVTWSK